MILANNMGRKKSWVLLDISLFIKLLLLKLKKLVRQLVITNEAVIKTGREKSHIFHEYLQ
ncbi:hypothetical protein LPICM17_300004 [Lactococcus piscium]|nr:hypothetical protein LPICM17_300004 [Lactococcus piscium]